MGIFEWSGISGRWSGEEILSLNSQPKTLNSLTQHVHGFFGGGNEGFDVFLFVVEGEGGADGAGDAETGHERLATVVAGSDGDAHLVEEHADVVVVDAFDVEG